MGGYKERSVPDADAARAAKRRRARAALLLSAAVGLPVPALAAADLSGTWVPDPRRATPLAPAATPLLTPAARERYSRFVRTKHDSVLFCMPFGTPRNTLGIAPRPVEILQTETQVTLIFDGRGDVRRIYLDDRSKPDNVFPSWMGYSLGRWEGDVLVVRTDSMTEQSILDDTGLPHSADMVMEERFQVLEEGGRRVLRVDVTLTDPTHYAMPIRVQRLFKEAPEAEISHEATYCVMDQWRTHLERRNKYLSRELARAKSRLEELER